MDDIKLAMLGNKEAAKRLTHEADFGFEDWEETLFLVGSDPHGAYNILDIARYQGEPEFDEILKNIALRLAAIENILGDEYDLERLREMVEADREGRVKIEQKARRCPRCGKMNLFPRIDWQFYYCYSCKTQFSKSDFEAALRREQDD